MQIRPRIRRKESSGGCWAAELGVRLALKICDFFDPDHLLGTTFVRNTEVGNRVAWDGCDALSIVLFGLDSFPIDTQVNY